MGKKDFEQGLIIGMQIAGNSTPTPQPTVDWTKPDDWPDISVDVPSDGISLLTSDCIDGLISFTCTGDYTVDWGDGLIESFSSGITAYHKYAYGTGIECSRGYTTFKIKITPSNGSLTTFKVTPTRMGILWCIIAASTLTDCSYMFFNSGVASCQLLERFEGRNMSSALSMAYMFYVCYCLKSVTILGTSNANNMYSMFAACRNLKTVEIQYANNVTDMSYMFSECHTIDSILLPATDSVTNASYMFYRCYALKNIGLFDTSKVTKMSSFIAECNSILDIPDFDTSSVNDFNYPLTIQNNFNLSKIKLPKHNSSKGANLSYNAMSYKDLNLLFDSLPINGNGKIINVTGNLYSRSGQLACTTTLGSTIINMTSTLGLEIGMTIVSATGSDIGISTQVGVTLTASDNLITRPNHGLLNDHIVYFKNAASTWGIDLNKPYYVVEATTDNFKVSLTKGGPPVDNKLDYTCNLLYPVKIVSIVPNVSITVDVPASRTGSTYLYASFVQTSILIGKGWGITW